MDSPRTRSKVVTTLEKMYPDQTIEIKKYWNDFGEWYIYGTVGDQEFYECGEAPCGPLSGTMIAKQIAGAMGRAI